MLASMQFTHVHGEAGHNSLQCNECGPLNQWITREPPADAEIRRELEGFHQRRAHGAPNPVVDLEERLHPDLWCARYGLRLKNADGWGRLGGPDFDEPLTLREFYVRARGCTQDLGAWAGFVDQMPASVTKHRGGGADARPR